MNLRKWLIMSLAATFCGLAGVPTDAVADEPSACLSRDKRREVIAAGQVVTLAAAIRTSRSKMSGQIVKAQLCQSPKGLVYLLTVLARDGKVARLTVDAKSGKLVSGR